MVVIRYTFDSNIEDSISINRGLEVEATCEEADITTVVPSGSSVVSKLHLDTYNTMLATTKTRVGMEVKEAFTKASFKPRVDTGLGYFVDGGRTNKDDFKTKWEMMADTDTTVIRTADNAFVPDVTKADMKTIWQAIAVNGQSLFEKKWQLETQLENATTVEEVIAIRWV